MPGKLAGERLCRVMTMLLVLFSSNLCFAQTFDRYVTLLDHTLATPRAIAIHGGGVYLAYDGGDVCRFDDQARFVRRETSLDAWYIVDLIVHKDLLYACSNAGDLLGLGEDGAWQHLGRFSCEPFIGRDEVMYVATAGELRTVEYRDGSWVTNQIGQFAPAEARIDAFAVRGDTVIYSANRDSLLRFSTIDTNWSGRLRTPGPVERMLLLEDGSLGVEIGYRMSATLSASLFPLARLNGIYHNQNFVSFENARSIHRNGKRGILGRVDLGSGYPNNGIYFMFGQDSVVRLPQFDTVFNRAYHCVYRNDQWALATISYLGIVDDSLRGRHYHAYGDTIVSGYGGFALSETHAPYRTGSVSVNGIKVPALMPSTELGSSLQVLDVGTSKTNYLSWYHRSYDGTEVGVTARGIIQRLPNDTWNTVVPLNDDPPWWRTVQLSRDVITWLSGGRVFVISTDAGRTWKQVSVKGMIVGISDLILSGSTLFAASYDQVWSIELSTITDSITPPVAKVQPSFFTRLMRSSDGTVSIITGRSRTDSVFNPATFTHFQVYHWDPATGKVDSNNIELAKPITSWSLQSTERTDTLFLWSGSQARLVAITRGSVAYDTTFTSLRHRGSLFYDNVRSYTDVNGTWWLINEARNFAVTLDPSRSNVVSVHEQEPKEPFTVSPNPSSGDLRLQFNSDAFLTDSVVTINIVDLFGNIVVSERRRHESPFVLSVADVPSGVYFILVGDGASQPTKPIIITH